MSENIPNKFLFKKRYYLWDSISIILYNFGLIKFIPITGHEGPVRTLIQGSTPKTLYITVMIFGAHETERQREGENESSGPKFGRL